MEHTIYTIRNIRNEKHYVGQTEHFVLDRIIEHIYTANSGKGYVFHKAIRSYGTDSFLLVETKHCPPSEANNLEREMVIKYNSLLPGGYNILEFGTVSDVKYWLGKTRTPETVAKVAAILKEKYVGEGNPFYGKTHSKESMEKASKTKKEQWTKMPEEDKRRWIENAAKARIGHSVSDSTRQKISQANTGKVRSDEARERNRQAHLGKKASEETKQKMSWAKIGVPKSEEAKVNMRAARLREIKPEQIERALTIKKLLAEGLTPRVIAARMRCTEEMVRKIRKGERYGWLG